MEHVKKFEFYLGDLTEDAEERFINFLGGDCGNHDIIPFCTYETVCHSIDCRECEWKCKKDEN